MNLDKTALMRWRVFCHELQGAGGGWGEGGVVGGGWQLRIHVVHLSAFHNR